MKILGISASCRQWGNTDILIHHVLQGAGRVGAETRFIRLTEFDIHQCRGCLSCLFKDRDCVIDDPFIDVLSAFREADGIVIGSPVYSLFAAGSIQTLIPRFFRQAYTGEFEGKPGIALAVGGRPGWEGWALQQIIIFFLSMGMPIIDQFTGYGQGPGEVLYDEDACKRALEGGIAMAKGETSFIGEPGICPVCHCDLVVTGRDGQPWCTVCNIPGRWKKKGEGMEFEILHGSKSRFDHQKNRDHFEKLILPSRHGFQGRKQEIGQKLEEFKKGNALCDGTSERRTMQGKPNK